MPTHNSCTVYLKGINHSFFFSTTGFARDIYHDGISSSVAGGCHCEDRIRLEDSLLSYFLFFLVGCMWAVAKKLTVYHVESHTFSAHTSFTPSSWKKMCMFLFYQTHQYVLSLISEDVLAEELDRKLTPQKCT